jgi:peptidyl-prolyl cis-trans isomerase A (cyclophilin A)
MSRLLAAALLACLFLGQPASAQTVVVIETDAGSIDVQLEPQRAPATVANFLKYVDEKLYDGGRFHRAVTLGNQTRQDVKIEVIQGGRSPESTKQTRGFGPIPLERTSVTGLKHLDGTISMARGAAADSAVSDFFICVNDQPSLDEGGGRSADGRGFAAFGRVIGGMDVVRRIQQSPADARERLTPPIRIVRIYRK